MERAIEASTVVPATAERVRSLFVDEPATVLPNPISVAVGTVRRDVVVTLDDATVEGDRVVLPLAWRAAEHSGLFPIFLGTLEAEPSVAGARLVLAGTYSIPLGVVGRFGDGLVGRRLAHDAVRNVLIDVAQRITTALGVDGAGELQVVRVSEPATMRSA